jgi:hypothetical protein
MKNIALCILTLGISTSAFGAACTQGATLTSYISTGACSFTGNGQTYTLGDYTFLAINVLAHGATTDDFSLSESVGANGPSVTITPDGNIAAGILSTETILLGFDITSPDANIGFSGVDLNVNSTLTGVVSTGIVAEEDCFGGALPAPNALLSLGSGGLACLGGGLSVGASAALNLGVGVNASVPIPLFGAPTSSVDVLKEINLTTVLGSATINTIGQSFTTASTGTATPEPGSFFLGGCGLLGFALVLRRKVKAHSPRLLTK